jgi:hypothetical protein
MNLNFLREGNCWVEGFLGPCNPPHSTCCLVFEEIYLFTPHLSGKLPPSDLQVSAKKVL